jgi:hypothetical protein
MSIAARIGRLLAVVIVFVVIGPPLGALVLVALVEGLGQRYQELDSSDRNFVTLIDLIVAVPVSYWYGTMPALAAALVIGVRQAFFGRATWPMVLATGLVASLIVLDRSGALPFAARPQDGAFPSSASIVILACMIATMACWGLVRHWCVAPRPALQRPSAGAAP